MKVNRRRFLGKIAGMVLSATLVSDIEALATVSDPWSSFAFPLIRKLYPSLSAADLVSVQPMNLPSNMVFFMDFKYGEEGHA